MAALKIQVHNFQPIHMIATKFQRLHPYCRGQATQIFSNSNPQYIDAKQTFRSFTVYFVLGPEQQQ